MLIGSNIRNLDKFQRSFDFASYQELTIQRLSRYCILDPEARAHHYDLLVVKVTQLGATVTETREAEERELIVGEWLVAPLIGRESTLGHSSVLPKDGVSVGQIIDYISTGGGLGYSVDDPPGKGAPTKVQVMGILCYEDRKIARAQDFALDLLSADQLRPVVAVVGSKSDAGKTTVCLDIIKSLHEAGKKIGVAKLSGTQQLLEIKELAVDANQAFDVADAGMPTTYPPSQENDKRTAETSKLTLEAADRILRSLSIENDIIVVEFGGDLLSASVPQLLADPSRINLVALVMAAESATAAIGMETKLGRLSAKYAGIPQYFAGPCANLKANRNRVLRETSCSGCFDLWNKHSQMAQDEQREASKRDTEHLTLKLLEACNQ